MSEVLIVGNLDVAELVFYIFFVFFIGLVIYLRREDRREGYPLEDEMTGRLLHSEGFTERAPHKVFQLPFDLGSVVPERRAREPVEQPGVARRTAPYPGYPLEPVANPIGAGVGPGAYALRAERPDFDMDGHPRIVPIGAAASFSIAPKSMDPRGLKMIGADGVAAGTINDLWVDKSDHLIRYAEVGLTSAGSALVPWAMCTVDKGRRVVHCDALNAAQFAGAPLPQGDGVITLAEEEKIVGYFGGGYLYANAKRAEPYL